ncbi:LysM peptidoglycan-binding domain-containing protein [Cohnella luojiensis]|uniref:LysM peptidoglycan-binding domain-containing protein n=2 Tax=Cohnella luojiensis TaxID=652876 RepID=A0A4Y8M2B1_9BACL|nr:3D domain-containing protein [Cohnella luojiensis]TFE27917.1 LysM peptidoglycan-binding domain-containing protein [Cohnella luojiensis]
MYNWKKLSMRSAALVLGTALMLPALTANAATPYTTKDTDTFWKLSRQFNVPVKKLMAANPKVDPLNIYAGLKLVIPSNAAAMSKPAAAKEPTITAQSITTSSGQSLSFSKVMDIKATAYSDSAEENGKWGPVDYFGNPLKLGTIAVDPKVIPFGTKVFITGYDFSGLPSGGLVATATDKGGAIKGNRIDIFVPGSRSFVSGFGYQSVKVYILK